MADRSLSRIIRTMGPSGQVDTVVAVDRPDAPREALLGAGIVGLRIMFGRPLRPEEIVRTVGTVEYWGSLPYVTSDPVRCEMLADGRTVAVEVDTRSTRSLRIERRSILEDLVGWLCCGTPRRQDGTSAVSPAGTPPLMIVVRT